jgi:hypothetical protein
VILLFAAVDFPTFLITNKLIIVVFRVAKATLEKTVPTVHKTVGYVVVIHTAISSTMKTVIPVPKTVVNVHLQYAVNMVAKKSWAKTAVTVFGIVGPAVAMISVNQIAAKTALGVQKTAADVGLILISSVLETAE